MSASAFFYGTLLHPKVLKRVIGNDGEHLTICPAVLLEHTRHRIKDCDYPGVVPYERSKDLFDHNLTKEERSVRGNVVVGLSKMDIDLLDVFEGDEYTREGVNVYPLSALKPLNAPSDDVVSDSAPPISSLSELSQSVETETYIWIDPTLLVPELWSYEAFVRDSSWRWVGPGEDRESYLEVDRRREMNGIIARVAEHAIEEGAIN